MTAEGTTGTKNASRRASGPLWNKVFGKGSGAAILHGLFAPVDIASIAFFRLAFGLLMFWELGKYSSNGWIGTLFAEPTFRFSYYGFDWIQPWPDRWMYFHFVALQVLALLIAVGFLYRISIALFFLGFTYLFLLDQANYLNHFYLICLISLLMVFIPANRDYSMDAWMRPSTRSQSVPAWTLWLLRAQVGLAYFFGGLAKLNSDWLRGEPMRMWLAARTDFPLLGRFFTQEWMVYLFTYGGLLLDLLVVPFLLWRRTRLVAFVFALSFHLMNVELFNIGIFPWFMIAATLLFFPPSWPRTVGNLLSAQIASPGAWRGALRRSSQVDDPPQRHRSRAESSDRVNLCPRQYAVVGILAVYLAVQLLVPLRHHLYPGNVNWTEEGHRFSWHMMLRHKEVVLWFVAVDPETREKWRLEPEEFGLTGEQEKEMRMRPDMILQFAHHAAEETRRQGRGDVEVRAITEASLNGRDYQRLIDPRADLSEVRRTLMPADWIVPLTKPFQSSSTTDLVIRRGQGPFYAQLLEALNLHRNTSDDADPPAHRKPESASR